MQKLLRAVLDEDRHTVVELGSAFTLHFHFPQCTRFTLKFEGSVVMIIEEVESLFI